MSASSCTPLISTSLTAIRLCNTVKGDRTYISRHALIKFCCSNVGCWDMSWTCWIPSVRADGFSNTYQQGCCIRHEDKEGWPLQAQCSKAMLWWCAWQGFKQFVTCVSLISTGLLHIMFTDAVQPGCLMISIIPDSNYKYLDEHHAHIVSTMRIILMTLCTSAPHLQLLVAWQVQESQLLQLR